jgi:hydroxyethylthiazole kinase-like sugar kinase family protein
VTETFRSEQDAKAFARAKLADGLNINVGTLNPHLPKRVISSKQVLDWLNEPDLPPPAHSSQ